MRPERAVHSRGMRRKKGHIPVPLKGNERSVDNPDPIWQSSLGTADSAAQDKEDDG